MSVGVGGVGFGQLQECEEAGFEIAALCASERSAGKRYADACTWNLRGDRGVWNLDVRDGKAGCRACGEPIAGVFEAQPGHWGARRRPLHFAMR